jgi:hypothetical protein
MIISYTLLYCAVALKAGASASSSAAAAASVVLAAAAAVALAAAEEERAQAVRRGGFVFVCSVRERGDVSVGVCV